MKLTPIYNTVEMISVLMDAIGRFLLGSFDLTPSPNIALNPAKAKMQDPAPRSAPWKSLGMKPTGGSVGEGSGGGETVGKDMFLPSFSIVQ